MIYGQGTSWYFSLYPERYDNFSIFSDVETKDSLRIFMSKPFINKQQIIDDMRGENGIFFLVNGIDKNCRH